MVLAYWLVAGLLALFMLYAGGLKLVRSQDQLAPMMGWVDTVPMPVVRLIGGLETLGAVGLILPPLTGIAAGLAVAAAIGFVIVQGLAIALHLSRGEGRLIGLNVALVGVSGLTAWLAATAF